MVMKGNSKATSQKENSVSPNKSLTTE